jgi:glycolate oxidase iron-sulfur subunit
MSTPAAPARTSLPVTPAPGAGHGIDYELFLDCVHCGLCTASCPTYLETGHEADSPRGRIYLMRAVTDGKLPLDADVRKHLDLCLDCRACETACPSGVQYGRLIEPFRVHMTRSLPDAKSLPLVQRMILNHVFPYNGRNRLALAPARLMQRLGVDRFLERTGLVKLLPRSLRQMHEMLPRLKPYHGRLRETYPAEGPKRARVALFVGCVGDAVFPETTVNTVRVLQKNGCEVWVPRGQGCCGALHYHSAQEEPAKEFARANCQAFAGEVDAIIVNAAGCGAMLKDYGHLLQDEAGERLTAKVRDVSEFLAELGPVKPRHPFTLKATYHDACHLCHAQQIRKPPRQLLEMIPGLTLVPLAETEVCCGAAGSYNLTQPDMAERLGRRKVENILATGAAAVFTGNVGCLLQVERHLRAAKSSLWVAHPIDALWASYSGQPPANQK